MNLFSCPTIVKKKSFNIFLQWNDELKIYYLFLEIDLRNVYFSGLGTIFSFPFGSNLAEQS